MPDQLRYLLAFAAALVGVLALTPVAIRVARRTDFLDHPKGYKGHAASTPYLGGLAVMAAVALPALAFGSAGFRFSTLALCAAVLWLVGTVDDRIGLHPLTRVAIEVAAALVLWQAGQGWDVAGVGGLLLTVVWVVGLVNAYNLMDNMDGAGAAVTAASAAGIGLIAGIAGDVTIACFALAICGATLGFLRFNLANPARIFLGDGGSMPLGFLIAALAMCVPVNGDLGLWAVAAIAPVAALPILDTALVMFSRRRRGMQLMSGGRDHLTHRLRLAVASERGVAAVLAAGQIAFCLIALALVHMSTASVFALTLGMVLAGLIAVRQIDLRTAGALAFAPAVEAGPVAHDQAILVAASPDQ